MISCTQRLKPCQAHTIMAGSSICQSSILSGRFQAFKSMLTIGVDKNRRKLKQEYGEEFSCTNILSGLEHVLSISSWYWGRLYVFLLNLSSSSYKNCKCRSEGQQDWKKCYHREITRILWLLERLKNMEHHVRMPVFVLINVLCYFCPVKAARTISLNWIIITAWNTDSLHTRYLHECFSLNIKIFPLLKACHVQRAG